MSKKAKAKKINNTNNGGLNSKLNFNLKNIIPLTKNQKTVFMDYDLNKNLVVSGWAGTGKTFISLYLALEELLETDSQYDNIIIIRSVVPSRDMGFLPGTVKEKGEVYEEPYKQICDELFGRGDAYDLLKNKDLIQFQTTSFLRGQTFRNSIVLVDECQNMAATELSTVMTRMGENSKIIFSGDFRQTDLTRYEDKTGLKEFLIVLDRMDAFSHTDFGKEDIVRSGLVKDFLIKQTEYEDEKYDKSGRNGGQEPSKNI